MLVKAPSDSVRICSVPGSLSCKGPLSTGEQDADQRCMRIFNVRRERFQYGTKSEVNLFM
jgi:hypothetical protein